MLEAGQIGMIYNQSKLKLMSSSSHIRRIKISVEPRNFRQTLDVYLLLYFFSCKLPELILSQKRLKWLLFKKIDSLVITLNEDDQLKK